MTPDAFLEEWIRWEWKPIQDVPLPDFVKGQAEGKMKIVNGTVFLRVRRKSWAEETW